METVKVTVKEATVKATLWQDPDVNNLSRRLMIPRQARVMSAVIDELMPDTPYTTREAADELGEYMSSVANSLLRLYKQGLVKRRADRSRTDCRVAFVWRIDSKAIRKRLHSINL